MCSSVSFLKSTKLIKSNAYNQFQLIIPDVGVYDVYILLCSSGELLVNAQEVEPFCEYLIHI